MTLRLLEAFVAILIGGILSSFFIPVCVIPIYVVAASETRSFVSAIEWASIGREPDELTAELLDAWLAEELPAENPVANDLREPRPDPWGNPYRVRRIVGEDGSDAWGVYSVGPDGKSSSAGDDPDDVNSWDPESTRWHQRRFTLRQFVFHFVMAAPFAILIYLLISTIRFPRRSVSSDRSNE